MYITKTLYTIVDLIFTYFKCNQNTDINFVRELGFCPTFNKLLSTFVNIIHSNIFQGDEGREVINHIYVRNDHPAIAVNPVIPGMRISKFRWK